MMRSPLLILAASTVLAGCSLAPKYVRPELPTPVSWPVGDAYLRQSEAALPAFRGDIMQVPPIFSAIKVAGERAYDLAREGQAVELAPRPARVDRFELESRPDADTEAPVRLVG